MCLCVVGLQVNRCVCLTVKGRNDGQSGLAAAAALQPEIAIQAGNGTALKQRSLLLVLSFRSGQAAVAQTRCALEAAPPLSPRQA